jgi:hypothetical protein
MNVPDFSLLAEALRKQLVKHPLRMYNSLVKTMDGNHMTKVDLVTSKGVFLDIDLVALVVRIKHLGCMPELNEKMIELSPKILHIVCTKPSVSMSAFALYATEVLERGPEEVGAPSDWVACSYHAWLGTKPA